MTSQSLEKRQYGDERDRRVVSRQEFTPFGDLRPAIGDVTQTSLDFTGQKRDGTGLLSYGARYYDPGTAKFVSPDPADPKKERPQSRNRFSYVYNNPLKHTDPDGLTPLRECKIDCQVDDFDRASWQERGDWLDWLNDAYGLKGWFNNVRGILRYFASSPVFSDSKKMSLADAGVLHAIQEGLAGSRAVNARPDGFAAAVADAAGKWKNFFDRLFDPSGSTTEKDLRMAWAPAEDAGVRYGIELSKDIGYKNNQEAQLTPIFVRFSFKYREAVAADTYVVSDPINGPYWKADPRYDEETVYVYARLFEAVVTTFVRN